MSPVPPASISIHSHTPPRPKPVGGGAHNGKLGLLQFAENSIWARGWSAAPYATAPPVVVPAAAITSAPAATRTRSFGMRIGTSDRPRSLGGIKIVRLDAIGGQSGVRLAALDPDTLRSSLTAGPVRPADRSREAGREADNRVSARPPSPPGRWRFRVR